MSASCLFQTSLMPFLYPFTQAELRCAARYARRFTRPPQRCPRRSHSTATSTNTSHNEEAAYDRLNPTPDDYTSTPFQDACTITITAGSGGNGCVSFLREKFIANGPPNGGEGGAGGNIYIRAVRGETSLHKIARRREVKAGRGKNGQGSSKNGMRGGDVVIEVPVGTVVRELGRFDPVSVEEEEVVEEAFRARERRMAEKYAAREREARKLSPEAQQEDVEDAPSLPEESENGKLEMLGPTRRDKFIMYPGSDVSALLSRGDFRLPAPRRSNIAALAPEMPITLDLDKDMGTPLLLAAGAMGGLGNPSFISKTQPLPKIATKGDGGVRIVLHMELKLLADVGLVGLPNAGKSTLLRAISNSRTRVGNWAFTTLKPHIGTVVLDDFKGRSRFYELGRRTGRSSFSVADIPGIVEESHLDKGLGLSFLRHIERARILAFVVDLAAGDAVEALKKLWREVAEYERAKVRRGGDEGEGTFMWEPTATDKSSTVSVDLSAEDADVLIATARDTLPPLKLDPMVGKPWFVVATKADLPETQDNFLRLQKYLHAIQTGDEIHPSGNPDAWTDRLYAIPISGIRGEGVEKVPEVVVDLLAT